MQQIHKADPHKIIIALVGLPARGKSYIGKKISRFLNWLGFPTSVFNIGNYRRDYMKLKNLPLNAEFFDNNSVEVKGQREEIAEMAMRDLVAYLQQRGGSVAILDGTNSTKSRRARFKKLLEETMKSKYSLMMVESICDDPRIIEENVKKVKIHNPDFIGKDPEEASKEFFQRIAFYEEAYQTVDKGEGIPFIKTINIGEEFVVNGVRGYLQEKIVTFVMNLTISPKRIIYLVRHGESQFNVQDRVGGDSPLTKKGMSFAKSLGPFFNQHFEPGQQVSIITSTLRRTIMTAEQIKLPNVTPIHLKVLDEINAGVCETLTYAQIEHNYPDVILQRHKDKLKFRYPSGQSYLDLISRLQPIVNWVQRQTHPIIIVAHQAVLRCIYAYFFKTDKLEIPHIAIHLHTIIKLVPETYFFNEIIFEIDTNTKEVTRVIEKYSKKSLEISEEMKEHHHSSSRKGDRGEQEIQQPVRRIKKVESQPVEIRGGRGNHHHR